METIVKYLDKFMNFFYTSSLSLFDLCMINILTILMKDFSYWFCLGYIPFLWYSVKQKLKYDILNGK